MKQRDFLIIITSVFILTVLWVIFNIYHSHITSTIKDPLTYQIIPISDNFDSITINKIKERKRVNPLFESSDSSTTISPTIPDLEAQTQATTSASDDEQEIQTIKEESLINP